MLLNFISNLYFYNILGGYFILTGLLNLHYGEYVLLSIGYIYGIPAVLLAVAGFFVWPRIRITKAKLYKTIFPVALFCMWILITAMVSGTMYTEMASQLAIYFGFWSMLPFVCGLFLSAMTWKIDYKWVFPILLAFLGLGIFSAKSNWGDILYGRYRVTGFADISQNTYSTVLGCYAIANINNIWQGKRKLLIKMISVILLSVAAMFLILFSGSMGGIIALIVTGILFLLISNGVFDRGRAGTRRLLFVVFFGGVILFSLVGIARYSQNVSIPYNVGLENIGKYVERIDKISKGMFDQVEKKRAYYIMLFVEQFGKSPLVGKGFGSRMALRSDPHNCIIELAGETGFVSIVLYAFIVMAPLKAAFSVFRDKTQRGIIFLASLLLVAIFFESFFSGSIFISPQSWFLIGFFPLSILDAKRSIGVSINGQET